MKKHRKCKKIIAFVTVLFIAFVAVIGLHKTGIYRFDFLKDIYKKIDFQLSTNELNIPQDALSFSVYDIEQEEYLFYEGDSQLPTVASLAKLFAIDYALGKVDLEDIVEVNQEVLELVPAGSSLANLYAGEYTVKQIMEAMLVPSGNDAAYALAYHIAKNELGEGYTATEYIDYFMTELSEYLIEAGYSKTNLYNDPSGASMQADSHLDDINRVALKLLNYDFVKECIGKSEFSIQTPQGEFTWKNTNEFLDENSPYYNANVKGMKTGTMASSYNIVVLYEKDGKAYLITCLAAHSNEGRYKAVQSAINTIIKYLGYLEEACVINRIKPYSSKTKSELSYYFKVYNEDVSFNSIRCMNNRYDLTHNLENIVYNELINRNYEVYIGKTKNGEVDFLAKKDGNIKYIQVTYEMEGHDNTIEREFGAYKSIEDNYPKYVISLDKIDLSRDGIIHLNLIDFLLSEEF